jgi:hypothetical protein
MNAAMKFVVGKEGYLFLDNDTNGVVSQTTGQAKLGLEAIERIFACHLQRKLFCSNHGIGYYHVIVPNKESVLTDLLPDSYRYESLGPTPVKQYLEAIPEASSLSYFDRSVLQQLNGGKDGYYVRDTHWNSLGAFAYFQAIIESNNHHLAQEHFKSIEFVEENRLWYGDLAKHAGLDPESEKQLVVKNPVAEVIHHGNVANAGYVRHSICQSAHLKATRILVLHDSFTHWLYTLIQELYTEALFIHCPDFDPVFVRAWRPDEVWQIQCERFFPRVPSNEISFPTWVSEQETAKDSDHRTSFYLDELQNTQRVCRHQGRVG